MCRLGCTPERRASCMLCALRERVELGPSTPSFVAVPMPRARFVPVELDDNDRESFSPTDVAPETWLRAEHRRRRGAR